MTAPDAIVIEGMTGRVEVPAELRQRLDLAEGFGEVLVAVARRFARLQIEIDEQTFALAKKHGENGDGVVLGQVQALDDGISETVSLVAGIIGYQGGPRPDLGLDQDTP